MRKERKKLIRIVTIDRSLGLFTKDQLRYLNDYYEVVGMADDSGGHLAGISEREGVRTIAIPMKRGIAPFSDLRSLWRLARIFRRERPHIVHSSTPKAGLLAMVAGWMTGVPHRLCTVTGVRFETTRGFLRWVLVTMDRVTYACATRVIPEGSGVADILREHRVTKKPMRAIHNGGINGIDSAHFDRRPEVLEQAKKEPGLSDDFTFLYSGRITGDKGVNELAAAFLRLHRELPATRLIVAGAFEQELCPIRQETMDAILNHPAIAYFPWQEDVRPFLAASNVLVLASYREGFPNVLQEAGAMSVPCIVSDICGCNEIIIDGENGLIVPMKDEESLYRAMRRMITDTELYASMCRKARPLITSRFERKDLLPHILEMYRSLDEPRAQ